MTEPSSTDPTTADADRAIDDAEPDAHSTDAPITTDDEAQKPDSVITPETT